jgi:hypothetical protein
VLESNKQIDLKFIFKSHPSDCVAAIVVSEIIDKLSPSIDPPNKAPEIKGKEAPLYLQANYCDRSNSNNGPTDVPVAVDKGSDQENPQRK